MARVINKEVFPPSVIVVPHEKLTKLEVPKGTEFVHCNQNRIEELIIPEGVVGIYCMDNNLKRMVLPESLRCIDATGNPNLKEITLPKSLMWANLDPSTNITNYDEISKDPDIHIRYIASTDVAEWRVALQQPNAFR